MEQEIKISEDGQTKTIRVRNPTGRHQKMWFRAVENNDGMSDLLTKRDEIVISLTNPEKKDYADLDEETKKKLMDEFDALELDDKQKVYDFMEQKIVGSSKKIEENFTKTSPQPQN